MIRSQDFKHLTKISGTSTQAVITPFRSSTGTQGVKSGTCDISDVNEVALVLSLGSGIGTCKMFIATSDTVSATFSGMTAITTGMTPLSGLTTSNTTYALLLKPAGTLRKFLGVKVSSNTAAGVTAVHAYGFRNDTVPARNQASGAAATGFVSTTILNP